MNKNNNIQDQKQTKQKKTRSKSIKGDQKNAKNKLYSKSQKEVNQSQISSQLFSKKNSMQKQKILRCDKQKKKINTVSVEKKLQKRNKELALKLKIMKKKLNKIQKATQKQNKQEIRNKIICINSEEVEKVPIIEFIQSQKKNKVQQKILRNQVIILNHKKLQKSTDLKKRQKSKIKKAVSQNKTSLLRKKKIQSTKQNFQKSVVRKSNKASLIRSTQKNSFKNLLSYYKKLKKCNDRNSIDKLQLKKMKDKVDEIQMLIRNKMQIFHSKRRVTLYKNQQEKIKAATKIQSFIRGYFIRKKLKNIFFNKVRTQQSDRQRKSNSKNFVIQSNCGVFTFSKIDQETLESRKKNKIEKIQRLTLLNSVVFYEFRKDQIQQLAIKKDQKNEELNDWQKQKLAIKKLEEMMNSQNHGEKQIEELLQNMKAVVNKNLHKFQTKKSQKKITSQKIKKTYSKDEMDIWPNLLKKHEIENTNNSFLHNSSEVSFFYTDRALCKKKKSSNENCVSTHKSFDQKEDTNLNDQDDLTDMKDDFEFIEIPIQPFIKNECQSVDKVSEYIEDFLFKDLAQDSIWQAFIFFSQSNQQTNEKNSVNFVTEQDEGDDETIYGIRTNINAVSEYCNLLIKYIEEHHICYFENQIKKLQALDFNNKFSIDFSVQSKKFEQFNSDQILDQSKSSFKVSRKNNLFKVWQKENYDECIFNQKMYQELENQILDNYRDMNINEDLFIMQKIYHKCIYDAFNEILFDLITGNKKFELTLEELAIFRNKKINMQKIKFYLIKSKIILLESTMNLCGIIQDKEDSMLGDSLKKFDPESLNELKREKEQKLAIQDMQQIINSKIEISTQRNFPMHIKNKLADSIEDTLISDLCLYFR